MIRELLFHTLSSKQPNHEPILLLDLYNVQSDLSIYATNTDRVEVSQFLTIYNS